LLVWVSESPLVASSENANMNANANADVSPDTLRMAKLMRRMVKIDEDNQ
jgi:hypothetical protein